MVDIVEIALNTITDFTDFEKLACEVLQQKGYFDIQRLGGMADAGQDAVEERYYYQKRKRTRTVFQITTQETIESKLKNTVDRLEKAEIDFTSLCLVTSREITTARIQKLQDIAHELDVSLTVMERKALSLVLSRFENGLFNRHFPNPATQLKIARAAADQDTMDHERLLRMAMAFTGVPEAERARQSVIRELALALLVSAGSAPITSHDLVIKHRELLPSADALHIEQINKALNYWIPEGLVKRRNNLFQPTEDAFKRASVVEMHWDRHRVALATDVVDSVENTIDGELDTTIRRIVERNTAEVISDLFRTFGLEVTIQLLGKQNYQHAHVQGHELLNSNLRKDLPKPIGELTAACLGDILSSPNDEQAEALSAIAYGYIGASLVQVDPAVRELQVTRIRKKTFVIDTDFLLDCIVSHQPRQKASITLVQNLTAMGARVVVPTVCIAEVADHASIAQKTVTYFGQSIFGLSAQHAIERINNKFAQGWYFRCMQGGKILFEEYLRNYYESSAPHAFMEEVVRSELSDEVEIGDVGDLLEVDIDYDAVDKLARVLTDFLERSKKSQYRTLDEDYSLAQTDARLYVAVTNATQMLASTENRALGKGCYLITSSTRFVRAVRRAFSKEDEVSARPETLAGLLSVVGKSNVTARDFVALFHNPFLQTSVANAWPDLEDLLKTGISLSGMGQARLTWDLENGLHQRIAVFRAVEEDAELLGTEEARQAADKSVIELLEESRNRGYNPMDHTDALLRAVEPVHAENARLSEELDLLTDRFSSLETEINYFGKRRQRYLRSVGRGDQKPPKRQ